MKKLLFLGLLALAGWYGYHHYPELLHRLPSNRAVIVNNTGHEITRVRLSAGETSIGVEESIPDKGSATFDFRVDHDAAFVLVWQYGDRAGEMKWSGGMVTHGPVTQKCTFTIDEEGQVIFLPENFSSGS